MTVSAAVKLMPSPPALVLSKKTKISLLQEDNHVKDINEVVHNKSKNRSISSKPLHDDKALPLLEVSDHVSTIHNGGRSIESEVSIFPVVHVVLHI